MDKMQNYEELKSAVSRLRKSGGKVSSNCYYFPQLLKEKIEEGNLRYEIKENGVILFEKFNSFEKIMMYVNSDFKPEDLSAEKGTICDIIFTDSKAPDEVIVNILEKAGFIKLAVNLEMRKSEFEFSEIKPSEGKVFVSGEKDVDRAEDDSALWKRCFDDTEIDFPSIEETREFIRDGYVIMAEDESGKVVGCILISQISNRTCYLRHICTSSEARGKGYAREMLKCVFNLNEKMSFDKVVLHVNVNNKPAISLYTKTGFTFPDKKIIEYIKKEGK